MIYRLSMNKSQLSVVDRRVFVPSGIFGSSSLGKLLSRRSSGVEESIGVAISRL